MSERDLRKIYENMDWLSNTTKDTLVKVQADSIVALMKYLLKETDHVEHKTWNDYDSLIGNKIEVEI